MKLNQYGAGEQTVTSALIAGGMVYFSTNRPVASTNSCAPLLGEARGYAVNLFTRSGGIGVPDACGGATSGIFTGGGLPPSPVQATVPVNGKNVTVCIGCASEATGNSVIDSSKVKFLVQPKRKRIYSNAKTDN
jgi:type IV pilus assembly protein PilY1